MKNKLIEQKSKCVIMTIDVLIERDRYEKTSFLCRCHHVRTRTGFDSTLDFNTAVFLL